MGVKHTNTDVKFGKTIRLGKNLDLDNAVDCSHGELNELIGRDESRPCPTCGSRLRLNYLSDYGLEISLESADCPECGHVEKDVIHRLQ